MPEDRPPTLQIPAPSGVFAEPWSMRKLGALMACFGPAAIVASVSIGAGETIVVVRAGAWAAYGLLWLVLLSCLVKGVFVTYLLGRYTAVSGELIGQRLVRLPGPRGWLLLLIVALELLGAPPVWAAIAKPCGDLLHHILAAVLPATLSERAWENLLSSAFIILAFALSFGTSFRNLERQQVAICGILVTGTIVGTLMVRPDLAAAAAGAVAFGQLPEMPPWTPGEFRQAPLLSMATAFAYVGGSVMGYVVYANWVSMHGWGITGHAEIEGIRKSAGLRSRIDYLPEDPGSVARLRSLTAPLRWDAGMGALVLFVVTAAFMISGAAVLYPMQARFEGWSLLTNQAHVWRAIHPALVWVYYVTVFAALWGTLQALPEIYARVSQEFFQAIWPARRWDYTRLQMAIAPLVLVPTLFVVWSDVSFDLLTQIAGFLLSNLAIAMIAVAAVYLNLLLPKPYRTRPWFLAGAILAAAVLIVAACVSGYGLLRKLGGL